MNTDNPRYPYTLACDYMRMLAGRDGGSTKISRADASKIRQGIAKAINMDDRKLAELIADAAIGELKP